MEAHVLAFPWPLQGHINPMLHLAAALLDAGLRVTLLHTEHNLRRLILGGVPPHHPRLRQLSIPDGLPEDHPRSMDRLMDLFESMHTVGSAAFRDLLRKETATTEPPPGRCSDDDDDDSKADRPPLVTCVLADGIMPFALSVAEDMGVPALALRVDSACGLLAYLSIPRLLELGETCAPSDELVHGVPGMEGLLRRRDLPRVTAVALDADPVPELLAIADNVARCSRHARAVVLNTAVSLEGAVLPHIARHMRDVFVVGPLHARARPASTVEHGGGDNNVGGWKAWLNGHKDRSVVYVNLGSLTIVSSQELGELIHGLAATGYAFLCVLRPNMVHGTTSSTTSVLLQEAVETAAAAGAGDRALMVGWALQQDMHKYVLRHRAVGCFLMHGGWNLTLEAAVEGVPVVCWPNFSDNHIVSRFVGAVWKTGLDMKDVCDRAVVERTVREAMESPEIKAAAQAVARQLRMDVAEGGSSASELERLVGFVTKLRVDRAAAAVQLVPSGDDVEN